MTQAADLGAIPNTRRDTYRARVNENVQALASLHAGINPPAPAYPFLCWADIGTGRLRMRDAANTSWIGVADLGPPIRWDSSNIAVNVRSYGALGNGVTDDTTAVQTALTAAAGKSLYFPPGVYLLSAQLVLSGGVSIYGAGQGVSELRWTAAAASRGIGLASSAASAMHVVRDLCLTTAGTTGVALSLDYSGQIVSGVTQDRLQPRFIVEAVTIEGATLRDSGDAVSTGWMAGISASSAVSGVVRDCTVHGRALNPYQAVSGTQGVVFQGQPATGSNSNGAPTGLIVDNLNSFFCDASVDVYNAHQVLVTASNIVAATNGVRLYSEYSHLRATVTDTHINAYSSGVLAAGYKEVIVTDCELYGIQTSTAWMAVSIDQNCTNFIVAGNIVNSFSGTAGSNGIIIQGDYGAVSGNIFDQQGSNITTCIWLTSTSSNIKGSNNIFHGTFTYGVLDQGTNNAVS